MDNLLFESVRKSLNVNLSLLKEIFESSELACAAVHGSIRTIIFSSLIVIFILRNDVIIFGNIAFMLKILEHCR